MRQIWLIFILVWFAFSAHAQEDESGLITLLRHVPDNPSATETYLTYVDYRALESMRGLAPLTNADLEDGSVALDIWFAAAVNISGGIRLDGLYLYGTDAPEAVGFSLFEIDRSLTFSNPPEMGVLIQGDFDQTRIIETLTEQGYTVESNGDTVILCGSVGCENGIEINADLRNPANPFGGDLGRSEPLALLPDGVIANSPALPVLESMLDTQDGAASLADNVFYRAIADTLVDAGSIVQLAYLPAASVAVLDPTIVLGSSATADDISEFFRELEQPDATLPLYELAAFADVAFNGEQIAMIALAYNDSQQAEAAAPVLRDRVANTLSIRRDDTFGTIFTERGGVIGEPMVSSTGDVAVLLLPIRSPIPGNEPVDGRIPETSMVYEVLIRSFLIRDTLYLTSSIVLPE